MAQAEEAQRVDVRRQEADVDDLLDRRDGERRVGGGAGDLVGAFARDRRDLAGELARDAAQIDEAAERVGFVEDVAQLVAGGEVRHEHEVDRRRAAAAVGGEGADEMEQRHFVRRFADEAAAGDVDVLAEARRRSARRAVTSGLTMVTASGNEPPGLVGAGGEDVAHGDGAGERARLDAGDRGHERESDARAIPRRVRQRMRGDLDAVDDDAGLAFAGAEEKAVAGEDDRIVDVQVAAAAGGRAT